MAFEMMRSTVLSKTQEWKQTRDSIHVSRQRGRAGNTQSTFARGATWVFSSISHGITKLSSNGRGEMRSGVPSAAHRLKLAHYSAPLGNRFVSSPEIIWEYAWPMSRGGAILVRRARVLVVQSLFGRSKVVAVMVAVCRLLHTLTVLFWCRGRRIGSSQG
jgi:hypothetical protein